MRLTQSILSSAGDCGLKAQYTLERPEWATRVAGSMRAVGTGVHAGIELHYRDRMDGLGDPSLDQMIEYATNTFDISLETDLYDNTPVDEVKWDDKVPDAETGHKLIGQMLTEYLPHAWPEDWTVLAVEHNEWFDDPELGEGVQTKLGADLVLESPDGTTVVGVDNKTAGRAWDRGKEHPRKNVQSPFYMRNLRRAFPGRQFYRFVFDIIVYPNAKSGPKFERRESDPQPMHEAAIAERARNFAFMYNTVHVKAGMDLPANPASTLCSPKFCDYFGGCPYGAALESAS